MIFSFFFFFFLIFLLLSVSALPSPTLSDYNNPVSTDSLLLLQPSFDFGPSGSQNQISMLTQEIAHPSLSQVETSKHLLENWLVKARRNSILEREKHPIGISESRPKKWTNRLEEWIGKVTR